MCKMKKIFTLLLAVLMIFTMTACSSSTSSDDETSTDEEATTTSYKDTLVWAIANDQDTLDPQQNVSNNVVLPQIYSTLVKIDMNNELAADLATNWYVDDSETLWTFELRDDVTWHNGDHFTSEDVVATFDRLLNPDNELRYYDQFSEFIKEVKAVDEYTVTIETYTPYGPFLAAIASCNASIMNKNTIEQYGNDIGMDPATINGTGPFKVTSWTFQEEMVLEKFDEYFDGPAKTQTIRMIYVPEQASRALALENHEVDLASGLSPDDDVRILNGEVEGVKLWSEAGNGMHLFQFNCSGVLADVNLRRAISHAIDREAIVEALYAQIGETAATAPVTPDVIGYSNLGVVEYDPDLSKQLLEEAGYADGLDITIYTTAVYNKGVEMGEIIKSQLAEVGINVNLVTIDRAQFLAQFGLTSDEVEWDMIIMGAGGQTDAGNALYRVWHTEEGGLNNNNYGFYSNSEVDTLLEQAAVITDVDERTELYKQAMTIIWETDPVGVFMNFRNDIYGMGEGVEGFTANAGNTPDMKNVTVAE